MRDTADRFAFGRNWTRFVKEKLDREKVDIAVQSLRDFLGISSLRGMSFLDIGCGSGLFSLAAHELGADKVTSFDFDADSVRCCEELRQSSGAQANWAVCQGSVLDTDYLHSLGKFDVVYSWGVLHHTGAMWPALDNAMACVNDRGVFFFSIYNRYRRGFLRSSEVWWQIKRLYNRLPAAGRKSIEWGFIVAWFAVELAKRRSPMKAIRGYGDDKRGMDWRRDITDWVGGWPYEYASPEEVDRHMEKLGWRCLRLKATDSWGCNEYLYARVPWQGTEQTLR